MEVAYCEAWDSTRTVFEQHCLKGTIRQLKVDRKTWNNRNEVIVKTDGVLLHRDALSARDEIICRPQALVMSWAEFEAMWRRPRRSR